MKRCPRCYKVYSDDALNFCLDDGELLENYSGGAQPLSVSDESPPTLVMESPRVTNPIGWQASHPIQPWQAGQQGIQGQYSNPTFQRSRDQTLPIISLILGIAACLMVCCAGGVWLGVPAAVLGFLGLRNAENDPTRYTGRGMAIGGIVLGIVTFLASVLFIIFGQLA